MPTIERRIHIWVGVVIFALVARYGNQTTSAGDPEFIRTLRSNDAAAGDAFGRSLALDGRLGIIGAPMRDEAGPDSGAAYLFDVLTGQQIMKLLPQDGQEADQFGISVSVQGDRAVVGAMLDDDRGRSSGAAYIFDTATGQQLHKLTASDGAIDDEFGVSVDIDDGIVLVGAHKNGPGAAYLFDVETGSELGVLQSDDGALDDLFGVAVAMDNGKALIGARYDDDAATASGSAYIFDIATQQQMHKLTPHDGDRGDRFGMHLDIGGNRAVVGSRYDDDAVKSSGSAYIYDVQTGEQLLKILADDTTPGDQFGSAVSVSGDQVLIGALDDFRGGWYAGSAYLFDVNTGEQKFKFSAEDPQILDRMGAAAALDGDQVLIGAPMLDHAEAIELSSGKAYVYLLPEPSSAMLLLSGIGLLLGRRRRRAFRTVPAALHVAR